MINAVGALQSILVLGGSSEIGPAITAEYLAGPGARRALPASPVTTLPTPLSPP